MTVIKQKEDNGIYRDGVSVITSFPLYWYEKFAQFV